MKILLIDVPLSPYSWNQEPAPPLGLLYLASAIKNKSFGIENDHEVVVLPLQTHKVIYKDDISATLIHTLDSYKPHVIGISAPTPSAPIALQIAQQARDYSPTSIIVLGGYQATIGSKEILSSNSFIDAIVRGEGEIPFCELINVIESAHWEKLHDIKGIAFRGENGEIHINPPANRIRNLDELPFPDRSLVPMSVFKNTSNKFRAGGIVTSRGCSWKCSFCYSPQLWQTGSYRSANNVVSEVEHIIQNYGINHIRFEDDTFTTNRQRIIAICDEIKKRGLEFNWEARTRVDLIDDEMLARMREAGLLRLQVGVETITNQSLLNIKKDANFSQCKSFFEISRKAGVGLIITVIVGLPSETPGEMLQTLDWVKGQLTQEDIFIRCIYTPFPGTYIDPCHNPVVLSYDLEKYTMDIPLVTSDLFTYSELVKVKAIADEVMQSSGPHHAINSCPPPIDI